MCRQIIIQSIGYHPFQHPNSLPSPKVESHIFSGVNNLSPNKSCPYPAFGLQCTVHIEGPSFKTIATSLTCTIFYCSYLNGGSHNDRDLRPFNLATIDPSGDFDHVITTIIAHYNSGLDYKQQYRLPAITVCVCGTGHFLPSTYGSQLPGTEWPAVAFMGRDALFMLSMHASLICIIITVIVSKQHGGKSCSSDGQLGN